MKKLLSILIILMSMISTATFAQDVCVDGIYYYLSRETREAEVGYDTLTNAPYVGDITIPETITVRDTTYTVTKIGEYAFGYNEELTSITIPNTVRCIDIYAFYDCVSLKSIVIPNSVTEIKDSGFQYCTGVTSLEISNSMTTIGKYAFSECAALPSVTIPSSVTSIGDCAFLYCTALTSIKVEEGNTIYDSRDNCNAIIVTAADSLIIGCSTTQIPASVTKLGEYSFYDVDITTLTLPDGLTTIGDFAFSFSPITSLTIPEGVTSIGMFAFGLCSELESLTFPSTLTVVGKEMIGFCSSLKEVYCYAKDVPVVTDGNLAGIKSYISNATLYVPEESIEAYKSADGWSDFGQILPLDFTNGITEARDSQESSWGEAFDLNGRRLNGLQQGINIIRCNNGTKKKLILK